jgi:hypothetical protein
MYDNANSKSTCLIEKTLNIFDESTETAFEQFEFNDVRGSRATVELQRDESHSSSGRALCVVGIAGGLLCHWRQTSPQQKDIPSEAVDSVPLSLSGPLHNRCMGGVEAG